MSERVSCEEVRKVLRETMDQQSSTPETEGKSNRGNERKKRSGRWIGRNGAGGPVVAASTDRGQPTRGVGEMKTGSATPMHSLRSRPAAY